MKEITIVGNIGRDSETREINGKCYHAFSVAVTEAKQTVWFDILHYFNGQGKDGLGQYLTKGKKVLVVGDISASAYVNKNNEPVPSLTCWARKIELLGDSGQQSQAQSQPQNQAPAYQQRPQQATQAQQVVEEDLPF